MAKPTTTGMDNIELLGVLAGIKPALRTTLPESQRAETTSRFESLGLAVFTGEQVWTYDGVTCQHLYVATSLPKAQALATAEARAFQNGDGTEAGIEARCEVGERLGYPRCCVQSFVYRSLSPAFRTAGEYRQMARMFFGRQQANTLLGRPSDNFLCAANGWVASPNPLLNVFRFGQRAQIISFSPCSLRCEQAIDLAEQHLAVLRNANPERAKEVYEILREAVAVSFDGARATVTVDRGEDRPIVRSAIPIAESPLRPPSDKARALAERLNARPVLSHSANLQWPEPYVVLEFATGDPERTLPASP